MASSPGLTSFTDLGVLASVLFIPPLIPKEFLEFDKEFLEFLEFWEFDMEIQELTS